MGISLILKTPIPNSKSPIAIVITTFSSLIPLLYFLIDQLQYIANICSYNQSVFFLQQTIVLSAPYSPKYRLLTIAASATAATDTASTATAAPPATESPSAPPLLQLLPISPRLRDHVDTTTLCRVGHELE